MHPTPETKNIHEDFHHEVIQNFVGLLESFNFKEETQFLGIGTFDFRKRTNMNLEFQAMYIGLWHIALCRSFPHDHDEIFQKYLTNELPQKYAKNILNAQMQRVEQYKELIQSVQNTDFSPVAHHILSLLDIQDGDYKTLNLKIALQIRSAYNYIFERLF